MAKFEPPQDDDYNVTRTYLQPFIIQYVGKPFHQIEDITLENLRSFLIPILNAYGEHMFGSGDLSNITDCIETYIHRRQIQEEPDSLYPILSDADPRSIGLTVLRYMEGGDFFLFPEDVPYFIEFLNTPLGQELEGYKKIESYVDQFDYHERMEENNRRAVTGTVGKIHQKLRKILGRKEKKNEKL